MTFLKKHCKIETALESATKNLEKIMIKIVAYKYKNGWKCAFGQSASKFLTSEENFQKLKTLVGGNIEIVRQS